MILDINAIADNLVKVENRWVAGSGIEAISYTNDGHNENLEYQNHSFWYQHRNRCIHSAINNFPCKWLIDVGGGNGNVSAFLQKKGLDVVLLEPFKEGITNALQAGLSPVIHASFTSAKFKPSLLQGVGLFDVLEHIEGDVAFIQEIHKSLVKGGRLYISVPAYQRLWSNFDVHVGHQRRYTVKQLRQLLNTVGFEVEYSTYLFNLLVLPMFVLRRFTHKRENNQSAHDRKKEHVGTNSFIGWLIRPLLFIDRWAIKHKKRIPFGTSCFIVARKM